MLSWIPCSYFKVNYYIYYSLIDFFYSYFLFLIDLIDNQMLKIFLIEEDVKIAKIQLNIVVSSE